MEFRNELDTLHLISELIDFMSTIDKYDIQLMNHTRFKIMYLFHQDRQTLEIENFTMYKKVDKIKKSNHKVFNYLLEYPYELSNIDMLKLPEQLQYINNKLHSTLIKQIKIEKDYNRTDPNRITFATCPSQLGIKRNSIDVAYITSAIAINDVPTLHWLMSKLNDERGVAYFITNNDDIMPLIKILNSHTLLHYNTILQAPRTASNRLWTPILAYTKTFNINTGMYTDQQSKVNTDNSVRDFYFLIHTLLSYATNKDKDDTVRPLTVLDVNADTSKITASAMKQFPIHRFYGVNS